LKKKPGHITVYEYEALKVGQTYDGGLFTEGHLNHFEQFYGDKGVPYFNLINKGVRFKEYVGVLQIGDLTVEVLPKADKNENKTNWRSVLIGMMRAVGAFDIKAPSSSSLNIKTNFILDLYFELFIKEVEYLFNKGLIKKYRKKEANTLALKGNLLFGKHIQQNLVHQERFYVSHATFDKTHTLHQILYKTLQLLHRINTNVSLKSRIGNLLLHFPEMDDIKVTGATFNKLVLNRKTESYKNAISIARLLLLKYHPDVSKGQNNVLALMFDMNMLWEKFIYVSLRKYIPDNMSITAQTSLDFWQSVTGGNSRMKPDIVIRKGDDRAYVLDTKWKNIEDDNPSPADLRQLFVYHEYYKAKKVALVYPGKEDINKGNYFEVSTQELSNKECSVIKIPTREKITDWQKQIALQIFGDWLNLETFTKRQETVLQ
jgi:5-methylcytosine-specific restriction enzyme subunit McrC